MGNERMGLYIGCMLWTMRLRDGLATLLEDETTSGTVAHLGGWCTGT